MADWHNKKAMADLEKIAREFVGRYPQGAWLSAKQTAWLISLARGAGIYGNYHFIVHFQDGDETVTMRVNRMPSGSANMTVERTNFGVLYTWLDQSTLLNFVNIAALEGSTFLHRIVWREAGVAETCPEKDGESIFSHPMPKFDSPAITIW